MARELRNIQQKSSARRGRRPRTVPVTSRTLDERTGRGRKKAGQSAGASAQAKAPRTKMDLLGYVIILLILLAILWAVATPLRNYYSGRAEIARLEASVTAKQAEKERLLEEINKYKSDAYAEQEARRRLGLVAEGETAYRIMDPRMDDEDSVTTDREAEEDSRPWYEVLWDSISEEPELLDGSDSATGDKDDGMQLPVEPAPDNPSPDGPDNPNPAVSQ